MFSFRNIGPVMRQARKQNKLTIKQVARMTGTNADTISDLENQQTNMKMLGLLDDLVKLYHIDYIPEQPDEDFVSVMGHKKLSPAARKKISKIISEDQKNGD